MTPELLHINPDGMHKNPAFSQGIVIPAGARHNIRNTGAKPMRLYTLYAPPHHADGTVQATRAEAMVAQESRPK